MSAFGHELGSVMAAVTVVEFSDFGCPHCARFAHETFPTLREEFIETGDVRWIFIPVLMGFPNGESAARTAQCAADQRQFWPMHDLLYERQAFWQSANPASADPIFLDFARSVGLDETRFLNCYREDHPHEITNLRRAVAAEVGIRGTPSFIVGDQFVEGTLTIDRFRQLLRLMISQGPTSPG